MAAKTAGTWKPIDMIGVASDLSAVDTTKVVPLGTRIRAKDVGSTAYGEGEFIYLAGVASTARGSLVTIDSAYTTSLLTAQDFGAVAVALAAVTAATSFGWYQIRGTGVAACDSGVADAALLYIDGTAGRCDDTAVAGDLIHGMTAVGTDDTNTVVVQMACNPFVGHTDNA